MAELTYTDAGQVIPYTPLAQPQRGQNAAVIADQGQPVLSTALPPQSLFQRGVLAPPSAMQPPVVFASWSPSSDFPLPTVAQRGVLSGHGLPAAPPGPQPLITPWSATVISDKGIPGPFQRGTLAPPPAGQPAVTFAPWSPVADRPIPAPFQRGVPNPNAGPQPLTSAWPPTVGSDLYFSPWPQPRNGAPAPGTQPLTVIASWTPRSDFSFTAWPQPRTLSGPSAAQPEPSSALIADQGQPVVIATVIPPARTFIGVSAPPAGSQPLQSAATVADQGQPIVVETAVFTRTLANALPAPFSASQPWPLPIAAWAIPSVTPVPPADDSGDGYRYIWPKMIDPRAARRRRRRALGMLGFNDGTPLT